MNQKLQASKKIEQITLKIISFNQQPLKKRVKNLIKILKLLENQQWALDMGVYVNLDIKLLLPSINQAKVHKIWLDYNSHNSIIHDISTITFPTLRHLSLSNNRIISIESLSFINSPYLQDIELRQNYITSLKPLTKLKSNEIKSLSLCMLLLYQKIDGNFIRDLNPLMCLKSMKLKILWLEYEDQEQVQGQSIAVMLKLKSRQLKSMLVSGNQRVNQSKIDRVLQKKYQHLRIYRTSH